MFGRRRDPGLSVRSISFLRLKNQLLMKSLPCLFIFICLVTSADSWGKNEKRKKTSGSSGVAAVIKTDGSMVYESASFDSKVIQQLSVGKKVRVSKKPVGEFGKFHKIRVKYQNRSVIGYISDIDLEISNSHGTVSEKNHGEKNDKQKQVIKESKDRKKHREKLPIYFTRYLGVFLGQINFTEDYAGGTATEGLSYYGFKATGPDVILDGPVMDFNLGLHYGAPSYYQSSSQVPPSGFILWTDAMFDLPLVQGDDGMVFIGAGPMLLLSRFNMTNSNGPSNTMTINLGLSLTLGAAWRVDRVAFRLEGKQFYEKQSSNSLQFSLMTDF